MITTTISVESSVSVNEDGQIVLKTGVLKTDYCSHSFDTVVLSRALSLAIAKVVIDAQEGSST